MGVVSYTPELEAAINRGDHIPPSSAEEVEIRAHTLYATALLTDAINRIRPPALALVVPQAGLPPLEELPRHLLAPTT